jgi:hypothetical protein
MATLGVHNEALQETYLGMPTNVGRAPIRTFGFLPDRAWKRMNVWSDRPPSRAGKETLIRAVSQAIPTYIMCFFLIPVATCSALRKLIADFWWGFKDGKRKIHWRSWEWLSTPKSLGGMVFRGLALFNEAMLGK